MSNPVIRPYIDADRPKVIAFLARMFPILSSRVGRLLDSFPTKRGEIKIQILADGEEVQGVVAGIFSERSFAGRSFRVCNITAWSVTEAYRTKSIPLFRSIFSDPTVIYTGITPTQSVYRVLAILGFRTLDSGRTLFPAFQFPFKSFFGPRVIDQPEQIVKLIDLDQRLLVEDHAAMGAVTLLLVQGAQKLLAILVKTPRGSLGLADVLYLSDISLANHWFPVISWACWRRLGTGRLIVDNRYLLTPPPIGSKKLDKRQFFFCRHELKPEVIDSLYSETALFYGKG